MDAQLNRTPKNKRIKQNSHTVAGKLCSCPNVEHLRAPPGEVGSDLREGGGSKG